MIIKKKAKMTMLVDERGATIRLEDDDSNIEHIGIQISPLDFMSMLGRLGHVEVDVEYRHLDRVGKRRESQKMHFKLPDDCPRYSNERKNFAAEEADRLVAGTEWIADHYFGLQGSFEYKGDELWANGWKFRWMDMID